MADPGFEEIEEPTGRLRAHTTPTVDTYFQWDEDE